MKILSAEFVTSAAAPKGYPPPRLPEIAFAGRSNVGKSSLINVLVNRKRLVKTSRTPGRTQLINFFDVNDRFTFVDLPGYGYAKVPEAIRRKWGPMIETYLGDREPLRGVLLLLDIRRTPGTEEIDLIHWFNVHRLPALLVATKADKLSRSKQNKQLAKIGEVLGVSEKEVLRFSAQTRQGRDRLWERIVEMAEPPQAESAPDPEGPSEEDHG
ncbi:MAG: ribosome biogenesis GTP-binding protein YihA/YsxC [Thermodesulfobacteriota bacterium]